MEIISFLSNNNIKFTLHNKYNTNEKISDKKNISEYDTVFIKFNNLNTLEKVAEMYKVKYDPLFICFNLLNPEQITSENIYKFNVPTCFINYEYLKKQEFKAFKDLYLMRDNYNITSQSLLESLKNKILKKSSNYYEYNYIILYITHKTITLFPTFGCILINKSLTSITDYKDYFALQEKLSSGSYGNTMIVKLRNPAAKILKKRFPLLNTENEFILKLLHTKLKKSNITSNRHSIKEYDELKVPRLLNEIKLIEKIDHPAIIKSYGCFMTTNHDKNNNLYKIGLLLEYAGKLSLYNVFSIKEVFTKYKLNIINQLFILFDAIKYLHNNNIYHRDIKLSNICINSYGEIKLIDFGLSSHYSDDDILKNRGTKNYLPINADEIKKKFDLKTFLIVLDYYAFFCVLYMIIAEDKNINYKKFEHKTDEEVTKSMKMFTEKLNKLLINDKYLLIINNFLIVFNIYKGTIDIDQINILKIKPTE